MNLGKYKLLFLFLLVLIVATPALAETRYVVDQIVVNFRDGKGKEASTIKNLRTGTVLEVLDEDATHVKARIKSGEEGYILKQYVTKKIPSAQVIAQLERDLAQAKKELEQLKKTSSASIELKNSAENELAELDKTLVKTRQDLSLLKKKHEELRFKSEHIVQLAEEKELLDAEHSALSAEVQLLRKENEGFQRSNAIRWFLAGGGVFLFGWLIGKISRKNRRDGFYR